MDINIVLANAHALESAHPLIYTALDSVVSVLIGGFSLPWLKSKGVSWVIDKAADWQESKEKSLGLNPGQIAALAHYEAKAAQQAADELKKRADTLAAAEVPKT